MGHVMDAMARLEGMAAAGIRQAQVAGATSLCQIAAALTARGMPTPSGSGAWHRTTVQQVLAYADLPHHIQLLQAA